MLPDKIKFVFHAVLLICCGGVSANDLTSDTIQSDPVIMQNQEADFTSAENAKIESISLYIDTLLKSMQTGEFNDDAFNTFFNALDKDPSAGKLIYIVVEELKRQGKLPEYAQRLHDVAQAHPEAHLLNIVAADAMLSMKRPEDAEKLLETSISTLLKPDAVFEKDTGDTKLTGSMLSKLILLYAASKKFDDAEKYVEFVGNAGDAFNDDPRVLFSLIALYSARYEQDNRYSPEPLVFFQTEARKWKRLQEQSVEKYLNVLSRRKNFRLQEQLPVFTILHKYGYSEQIANLVLSYLINIPNDPLAYLTLADCYSLQGNYRNAARVWQMILKKEKQPSWDHYLAYGDALHRAGKISDAVNAYELGLLVEPKNPVIQARLAWIYFNQANFKKVLPRASRIDDLFEKNYLQALCYDALRDTRKAQEAMKTAYEYALKNIERFPRSNRRDLAVQYAHFAEKNNDIITAERVLRGLLEEDPDNAGMLNNLGYLLADHNLKLDEAEKMLRRSVELDPDAPEVMDSMAWVCYRLGRYEEALEWISKCIANGEESPEALILDHAADIYHALEQNDKALEYWKRALEITGDFIEPDKKSIQGKIDSLTKN